MICVDILDLLLTTDKTFTLLSVMLYLMWILDIKKPPDGGSVNKLLMSIHKKRFSIT